MIDRTPPLPLTRQAKALGISRGTVYYLPRPVPPQDLSLMRRIDELHLEHPFAGSRMLRDLLGREGVAMGRKHVATLMRRMVIDALYRTPNTSRRHPGHRIYRYLRRGVKVAAPNQVRAMDISYIPMARGFVYPATVIDWYSTQGARLARVDHDGDGLLHRGAGRGLGMLRHAPDRLRTKAAHSPAKRSPVCSRNTASRQDR